MRRALVSVGIAALLLAATGCQPLYLPPVPAHLELPSRPEVGGTAEVREGRPALRLTLRRVPEEGWLAVQWFDPGNREVASQSLWIGPAEQGREVGLALPADVEPTPGRWRAVLSQGGMVLRQFSIEVAGR